jgi:hypothetical protein
MEESANNAGAQLSITVQLLHPINHDGRVYTRGLHDLDADLARQFLSFRDPISKRPIAQLPEKHKPAPAGTVEPDRSAVAYRR